MSDMHHNGLASAARRVLVGTSVGLQLLVPRYAQVRTHAHKYFSLFFCSYIYKHLQGGKHTHTHIALFYLYVTDWWGRIKVTWRALSVICGKSSWTPLVTYIPLLYYAGAVHNFCFCQVPSAETIDWESSCIDTT